MAETIRPRVFVSSVMEGYQDIREAARQGITDAGAEPFLIEDYPAADSSPRNACLDGVRSCDAFLLIIGERGGWVPPSGKLVVEEEYDEALRCKLPVFLFVQNVSRDDQALDLKDRLSDYIDGRLRATFDGASDLPGKLAEVFTPFVEQSAMPPRETSEMHEFLSSSGRSDQGSTRVRTAVIIERSDLLEAIASASNASVMHRIGLDSGLFSMEFGTRNREGVDSLILEQHEGAHHGRVWDSILLSERGSIFVESSLEPRDASRRSDHSTYFLDNMVIDAVLIERRVASALMFSGAVFDEFDKFSRFARFFYNVSLVNYSQKSIERNPQPRNSMSIPMYPESTPVVAFDRPEVLSREDLRSPGSIANRAVSRIERRLNASRQNY